MNIRMFAQEHEKEQLSKYAFLSCDSKGRPKNCEEDDIRTCFQRDRDKIIHSKEFRRLKHKTQVFAQANQNDHIRTRLIHTLEVTQVARTIARALRLNEDLTEAIAMGHDIGHCAFSHSGERVLNEIFNGFSHSENSAKLAYNLNLTYEVIDGIRSHSDLTFANKELTLEGKIVCYSDKIAYLNSDMDDGIRMGIISENDIPKGIKKVLGDTSKQRLSIMIIDIIQNSDDKPDIVMSEEIKENFLNLRDFMFDNLYFNPKLTEKDEKVRQIIYSIYESEVGKGKSDEEILEYIAGMSDSFAEQYISH